MVTVAMMKTWNRWQHQVAVKKAQRERLAQVLAVMKPKKDLTQRKLRG